MTTEHTFIILFSIATAVAIAVSRTRIPYTVALVIVGLIVGAFHIMQPPHLTKALLFTVFLPGLVFEAAYNLQLAELRRGWRTVATLAGPGVIAAILIAGLCLAMVLRATGIDSAFTWRDGLVFAALVSATDPIAVVSLFRKMHVSDRLTTLIEAESLFNDGTAIVALTLILAFVSGQSSSVAGLIAQFILVVFAGAAIGAGIAYVVVRVTRHVNDPMIEITLTTIAAYGSFALAEAVGASGVIATVAAGLVLGTAARATGFGPETRVAADAFWQYIAFALNSIVFLLIGFEVRLATLVDDAAVIAIAFVIVVATRLIVVYSTITLFRKTTERVSSTWAALMTWGGLRGALAMVLALALPAELPERERLIDTTFGVVLASLLIQGLTIPLLAGAADRQ